MGIDAKNNDVFQLLKQLKDANGDYPQDLLVSRRQGYLKHVAEISGGAGLAVALKNTAKSSGRAASLPPAAGTLFESLLVIAIVLEAGTVTYLYRDKIKELFQGFSNSPKVEEITNPPVMSSPVPGLELSLTPVVSETVSVTETTTPVGTPSLLAEQPTNQGADSTNGSESGSSAVSTPAANGSNGNNGNQYGHTPIPARTKEPGNNNTNSTPGSNRGP
jgi:hypothetical protein